MDRMNTDSKRIEMPTDDLTEAIIGAAFTVQNELGNGFLEKVYEKALAIELRDTGRRVETQKPLAVKYHGQIVGEYLADMLIDGSVLVEFKAVQNLDPVHMAQCMNYLKATKLPVCLLLNFGQPRVQVKRIVTPSPSV